ncbi:MAG: outer membrane lipoprotein-sorting protein [Gammaproteobacteria bacterium]|nr:outer membrane lipoprotein-sorting protein [Pseudomonadales bacterium]
MTGEELARAVYERPDGIDMVSRGTMTLRGEDSRERVRETYIYRTETGDFESRWLIRFTQPANIAGTGLLVHNHGAQETDQWLYLPAAKRVRRVSSENRGGNFVQSDIYYEDLQDRPPTEDAHRLLGIDAYQGTATFLLESIPREQAESAYSKRVSWIHPETLIPLRIDFYQGGDEPVKRMEVQRLEQMQGYWTVMSSTMTMLSTGHKTIMAVESVVYDTGLPDELFSIRALSDVVFEERFRP